MLPFSSRTKSNKENKGLVVKSKMSAAKLYQEINKNIKNLTLGFPIPSSYLTNTPLTPKTTRTNLKIVSSKPIGN